MPHTIHKIIKGRRSSVVFKNQTKKPGLNIKSFANFHNTYFAEKSRALFTFIFISKKRRFELSPCKRKQMTINESPKLLYSIMYIE